MWNEWELPFSAQWNASTCLHNTEQMQRFWGNLVENPYDPELTPTDFHIFIKLKKFYGGQLKGTDEEGVIQMVEWTCRQVLSSDFFSLNKYLQIM